MRKSLSKKNLVAEFTKFVDEIKLRISKRKHYPRLRAISPAQCVDQATVAFIIWLSQMQPATKKDLKFYPENEFDTTQNGVFIGHDSSQSGFLFTRKTMEKMLAAARDYGTEAAARSVARISKRVLKQLYSEFPTFYEQLNEALEDAIDYAEGELYNRAVRGDGDYYDAVGNKIVVYNKLGYKIAPHKSDTLLQFYMRAVRERYATTQEVNLNVSAANIKDVTDDVLLRIIEQDNDLLS